MESSPPKRRFPPPWTVVRTSENVFVVQDANGVAVASVYCDDAAQVWTNSWGKLTSDEARRIAKAISRLPEFMGAKQT